MSETRLYVGNLAFKTTESDIKSLFDEIGGVVTCSLVLDRATAQSRGFAFVEMASEEEANKAIEALNGKDFDGRALTVNIARPREDRPRGGGGFGGGGGGGGGGFGGGGRDGGRGGRSGGGGGGGRGQRW